MQTVATHQAPRSGNHTAFPIPVQDQETARYECRYSNLLGKHWSDSERSLPLEVTRGTAVLCVCMCVCVCVCVCEIE